MPNLEKDFDYSEDSSTKSTNYLGPLYIIKYTNTDINEKEQGSSDEYQEDNEIILDHVNKKPKFHEIYGISTFTIKSI